MINLANTRTFWTGVPLSLLTKRFFSEIRLWKVAVCSLNMGPQQWVLKDSKSVTKKTTKQIKLTALQLFSFRQVQKLPPHSFSYRNYYPNSTSTTNTNISTMASFQPLQRRDLLVEPIPVQGQRGQGVGQGCGQSNSMKLLN